MSNSGAKPRIRRNQIASNRPYSGGGSSNPIGGVVDPFANLEVLLDSVAFNGAGDLLYGLFTHSDFITTDVNGVTIWDEINGNGALVDNGVTAEQPAFNEDDENGLSEIDFPSDDTLIGDAALIARANTHGTNGLTALVICEAGGSFGGGNSSILIVSGGTEKYELRSDGNPDIDCQVRIDSGSNGSAFGTGGAKSGFKSRGLSWDNSGGTVKVWDGNTRVTGGALAGGTYNAFSAIALAVYNGSSLGFDGAIQAIMVYTSEKSIAAKAEIDAAIEAYSNQDLQT